jgi:hypothetical protein
MIDTPNGILLSITKILEGLFPLKFSNEKSCMYFSFPRAPA